MGKQGWHSPSSNVTVFSVVYFNQQMHACTCVPMVENNARPHTSTPSPSHRRRLEHKRSRVIPACACPAPWVWDCANCCSTLLARVNQQILKMLFKNPILIHLLLFYCEPVLHDQSNMTDWIWPNLCEHDRHDDNDKHYLSEYDRNYNNII